MTPYDHLFTVHVGLVILKFQTFSVISELNGNRGALNFVSGTRVFEVQMLCGFGLFSTAECPVKADVFNVALSSFAVTHYSFYLNKH